jgi:hypothetical protein
LLAALQILLEELQTRPEKLQTLSPVLLAAPLILSEVQTLSAALLILLPELQIPLAEQHSPMLESGPNLDLALLYLSVLAATLAAFPQFLVSLRFSHQPNPVEPSLT